MRWSFGLLLVACCAAVGCESPIVGASCRPGFSVCADGCVDLQADYRNCGECDNNCGQYLCKAGMCSSMVRVDAGAGTDGGGVSDAGTFDPDTGIHDSCSLGFLECDGACVDVTSDLNRCGACDRVCGDGEFCAYGRCWADCTGDLKFCGGLCRDLTRDPENCGTCDGVCTSGVCVDGQCDEPLIGQVVVIGHDYMTANPAMRRIAGNAISLPLGAQVRVLMFRGEADQAAQRGVQNALEVSSHETGRVYMLVDAVESLVPVQLSAADVFVIHAQAHATNSTLRKLGRQWANALAQFVARGGTVVLFDAPSTSNDGTYQILAPSTMFSAGGREEIPNQELRVKVPGNSVVLRVPLRYLGTSHSVHFSDVDSEAMTLVADDSGAPVVMQRFIVPK
jgi:Stigma-specific protein, Stig1